MVSLGPPGGPKGWDRDSEDFEWLDSLEEGTPFAVGDYEPRPKSFPKPSTWLRIENQGQTNSCNGHAGSTVTEVAYNIATQGKVIQLSPWYAYAVCRQIDGIRGDNGSTISGMAKTTQQYGLCPLYLAPDYIRSANNLTDQQNEAAKPFRLNQFRHMRTVEDVVNWVDANVGAIDIGVRWGRGGHAISIIETVDGKDEVRVANSWGPSWGENGFFRWTYRELERKLRDSYTVAIGMTDMEEVKPREIDWGLL